MLRFVAVPLYLQALHTCVLSNVRHVNQFYCHRKIKHTYKLFIGRVPNKAGRMHFICISSWTWVERQRRILLSLQNGHRRGHVQYFARLDEIKKDGSVTVDVQSLLTLVTKIRESRRLINLRFFDFVINPPKSAIYPHSVSPVVE
jgi:hypothetical protein